MNWKKWNGITIGALAVGLTVVVDAAVAAGTPPAPAPPSQPYVYVYGSSGTGSYLGVDINDVTPDRVAALKLKEERGVEVTMVDRDAPAGKAGLKEHDVILDFNGARVEGEEQLKRMIHETPPGRSVTLGISRDGQLMQIPVTLGDKRKAMAWGPGKIGSHAMPAVPPMPEMPEMPDIEDMHGYQNFDLVVRSYSSTAGIMADNLTPQLGEFFGVKSGKGVLVRSVEKGSPAEAAGLKAGDVIVKVDDEAISDRSDWRRALRDRKTGKVKLGIVRDKREQSLQLTLPERKPKDSGMNLHIDVPSLEDLDADIDISGLDELNDVVPMINRELELSLPRVKEELAKVQVQVARDLRDKMKDIRPEINAEMEKARKQLDEEMKKLDKELQRMSNNRI